ncbi:MAG: hypothetical protein GW780_00260 [Candidatus Aenigmarchaeota archaeon]|nr:hypothetical protein [Candidatus Aenigmarchaeota archaeon]OIN85801.1 MAG: hypothetical protein AUJ50_04615 [Candidatus Aenigmarchaeota archaeon CG1_02_38_14]PIV69502.1 MAG: hypothetical protein COS07_00500 [Candidatus Aenigmarchaeota archaeon CG01_land_8_20_14_3_00_37_9]PIW41784.1 MAG: hypothetical protein COW21_00095 [Candidatus Aenigmarchaeota archaeon CG15_BIG_FIL_POST_REV_8_21_14_020_37_27]PIX50733.1 MAG: hypothetical protein COZ52_02570 [Candidatus Aenigmarchaeota archaeon CG_4_8_14_3_u
MEQKIKYKIVIIALAVLLFSAAVYIGATIFQRYSLENDIKVYQQGYTQGVYDTVASLYQQTQSCQQATINMGNITRTVVDNTCKQK